MSRRRRAATGSTTTVLPLIPLRRRQTEEERRTFARFWIDPDASLMTLDNFLADRKPDARTGIIFLAMQPLKPMKMRWAYCGSMPMPIVLDGENPFLVASLAADLYRGIGGAAKLERVAQQILE